MPGHDNEDRLRAERVFAAREQQKADAPQAIADYYAAQQRLRERTQELRQLRLAREAQSEAQSEAQGGAQVKRKRSVTGR